MPPVHGLFLPLLCLCTCLHAVSAQQLTSVPVPNFGLGLAYGYNMQLDPNTNFVDFQNAAPAKWTYDWSPYPWSLDGVAGFPGAVGNGLAGGFLLGFNEPNNAQQANVYPADAASNWTYLEQAANQSTPRGLIGSPAVASCGANCMGQTANANPYGSADEWLSEFLGNCTPTLYDCTVDFIAFHSYPANCEASETISDLTALNSKYNLPVMLTEFSCSSMSYMQDMLSWLNGDSQNFMVGYAWYGARTDDASSLFDYESAGLTAMGLVYFGQSLG